MPSAHVGQVCAAQYSGTGEWHRCYVVEKTQKEAQVTSYLRNRQQIFCVDFVCALIIYSYIEHKYFVSLVLLRLAGVLNFMCSLVYKTS